MRMGNETFHSCRKRERPTSCSLSALPPGGLLYLLQLLPSIAEVVRGAAIRGNSAIERKTMLAPAYPPAPHQSKGGRFPQRSDSLRVSVRPTCCSWASDVTCSGGARRCTWRDAVTCLGEIDRGTETADSGKARKRWILGARNPPQLGSTKLTGDQAVKSPRQRRRQRVRLIPRIGSFFATSRKTHE